MNTKPVTGNYPLSLLLALIRTYSELPLPPPGEGFTLKE